MDENDRRKAGTLPVDPEADTEEMRAPLDSEMRHLRELLPEVVRRLARRADGLEKPIPLPWPTVAEKLGGGLWPGLHVVTGNTGTGKTQFALQAALHAAKEGTPVLYIALEAGDVEFGARVFGMHLSERWSALFLKGDKLPHMADAAKELSTLPFVVEFGEPNGWNAERLDTRIHRLRAAYPEVEAGSRPVLVVLDFLQLVGGDEDDIRGRIRSAAYAARAAAREHNAAVLVVSSTSRENYLALTGRKRKTKGGGTDDADEPLGKGDPARFVGMGKESGEIEYAADSVLVLTQEPWPDDEPPKDGTTVHLAVAKWRTGRRGWVELRFDGSAYGEPPHRVRGTL